MIKGINRFLEEDNTIDALAAAGSANSEHESTRNDKLII